MADEILVRADRDGIAALTLNRPDALNALSDDLLAALSAEIAALENDRDTRVVILRGAGKVFCAGHDLKEMQLGRQAEDSGASYFADLFRRCADVMLGLQRLPQPVIAEVHGIATAAGCQLVASCDMAVAAEGTRFGVNGVNIGLFCSTPMVALTRNVPRKVAFEMLTTGAFIIADRAREVGLVNHVVSHVELREKTLDLAKTVAGKLDAAVKIGKRAFYDQIDLEMDAAYAHAAEVMTQNMLWRDTDEGIDAFLAKRKPDWAR
ncbi:enoyl-CoA hydratase [Tropicimonas isoalkanivorans]|uniref:Enoyl-CoA hydratase domain-containing protein 3, mitochondrial n=1 Tax=Tropicimonas isoalkanivorans TaxID=441112 RepID=A0A1I1D9C5_9RHOB|nr:enoyl-CoA hydratase [Tropicimonas isoalkanivorans]SFB70936.1 Enoyl-CoA hydratase/carnithine racemase [Tropicimonas isoalkanivorans]